MKYHKVIIAILSLLLVTSCTAEHQTRVDKQASAEPINSPFNIIEPTFIPSKDSSITASPSALIKSASSSKATVRSTVKPTEITSRNTSASVSLPKVQVESYAVNKVDQGVGGDYICGTKTKCTQMSDCAEARFFHSTCSLSRLDGDDDGVPCESLCE